jgi:predicted aspartyl protease
MIRQYLDENYPPMPALEIRLGYPEEALRLGPVVAILDTGADGTIVPQDWLDRISAPLVDEVRVRGHWGDWRIARVFTVDLGIGDLLLPGIEVVGDEEEDEAILGRNVLNRLKLLLDGPQRLTELLNS